jgi:homoserine O-acetyltransferase
MTQHDTAPRDEVDIEIGPLALDCGTTLESVVQRVSFYGAEPIADGSNVVYVAHALTGSGRVREWWNGFVGPGYALDTNRLCIVGASVLGGCYGSTGPASFAPDGKPYGSRFPVITVNDIVRAKSHALTKLGIHKMAAITGGSLGGMQALTWVMDEPERFANAMVLGAYDSYPTMAIGLSALSRTAIRQDPGYHGGDYYDKADKPDQGLSLARMIAMLTYKSAELFAERFGRRPDRAGSDPFRDPFAKYDIEGYLHYQGQKFVARMDANAYLVLMRAMDLYHLHDTPTPTNTSTRLTFVGISSDWRCEPKYIREAAERFSQRGYVSQYYEMESTHGHDAFLADLTDLTIILRSSLSAIYAGITTTSLE